MGKKYLMAVFNYLNFFFRKTNYRLINKENTPISYGLLSV